MVALQGLTRINLCPSVRFLDSERQVWSNSKDRSGSICDRTESVVTNVLRRSPAGRLPARTSRSALARNFLQSGRQALLAWQAGPNIRTSYEVPKDCPLVGS